MKRFEQTKVSPVLTTAIAASAVAVFIADVVTPLGIAVWVLSLLPLALSLFQWKARTPVLVAAASTIFMVIGYLEAPLAESTATHMARINRGFGIVTIWFVALTVRRFILAKIDLRERDWIRSGQRDLSLRMQGELATDELGGRVLAFLCQYLDVPVAALYLGGEDPTFRRCAAYALGKPFDAPVEFAAGQGLLGQAVKDRRLTRFDNLPANYLSISSALGKAGPAHLVVLPTEVDGAVNAAIELGFVYPVGQADMDLLRSVSESIAIAIRSAQYRKIQAELLRKTTEQAKELEAQQEDLRAANEELQQQSTVLEESQARLETQQAELEQTNCQLEEQTQALEQQHDDLVRTQAELVEKAEALERTNQYKSEFLANMSHELRTPLNSALILAKMLADNKDGNLTPEQVKVAATIHSSGNDLLELINDILDLSSIEAGGVEIKPEPVSIESVAKSLKRIFQPMATQKRLDFELTVDESVPATITTDPLRLQQILRNLLSNAVKFTERGRVSLVVSCPNEERVCFAVEDTGVGIRADQRDIIFEAFRQADGSTQRKYGGTGLGLTISRELARRLSGSIVVESEFGHGSVFTLTLPRAIKARAVALPSPPEKVAPRPSAEAGAAMEGPTTKKRDAARVAPRIDDDRDRVQAGDRSILVVEDDERFALILRDLVRESSFRCLVATTAEDARDLAERLAPSACLLDVNLPDESGLVLLDRLKRSPTTRHIPIHMLSVADYAQQALAMGAIGYAVKPVRREQIVAAIESLERKLAQDVRRILVVEGNESQQRSIEALLRRDGVELVIAAKGAAALEHLQSETFDCMILGLVLPDMSGYDLLDKLATAEALSFPPVIVYASGAFSTNDERRLRRYENSVIVKGVRSPERLLDEVSLFLHQVEAKLPPEQQQMLRLVRRRDSALEGRTLLLVEDDARNIFALSSVFEPKGAKLRIARNGQEALALLAETANHPDETIDLVLMDVMMPIMDGLTATREIRRRADSKKLPIIALTAKAMPEDRQKCIDAGVNDYIPKPLDIDKLVALVKVWLPK
jgi:signal transduction histidine kinase/DNA-binding response OmpR family regulator